MQKAPKRQPRTDLFPANQLRGFKEIAGLRVEDLAVKAERSIPTVNEVLLGEDTRISTLVEVAKAVGARVKIEFEPI